MTVNGKSYRTIWLPAARPGVVRVIDQRHLPHRFVIEELRTLRDVVVAIRDMHVRGAGLIGVTAGCGMYLAACALRTAAQAPRRLRAAAAQLAATRPTAVNLRYALERQLHALRGARTLPAIRAIARATAEALAEEDRQCCARIGAHGLALIVRISRRKRGAPVNILTHCNAGWLAFVDYGSATAPIYAAHARGIKLHVWVDETRPRNQGAMLTAWELGQQGVPHHVIVDNAGGHLMQHGLVDLVLVGADRVTRRGDAANKIGTYLKALAAHANRVPFYVALPSSTFDWSMCDGLAEIPIEERGADEVRFVSGTCGRRIAAVLVPPAASPAANPAFDVTPARLITGLITGRGVCAATARGIRVLFPEARATRPARRSPARRG